MQVCKQVRGSAMELRSIVVGCLVGCVRRLFGLSGLLVASCGLTVGPLFGSAFDVVITEIGYNVFRTGSEDSLEFIEIYNGGPQAVDLSGWSFRQGVEFDFPAGSTIDSKSYAVVSPAPAVLQAAFGIDAVFGPWTGRLDNGGEILELADASGATINRLHYGDGPPWPRRPDGRGPTLEFTGLDSANDLGRRWKPSEFLNGTPGEPNSRLVLPPSPGDSGEVELLSAAAEWSFFRGRTNPTFPLDAWTRPEYDASAWETGAAPIGFGLEGVTTVLDDMRGAYTSLLARNTVSLDAEQHAEVVEGRMRIDVEVSYDDGFLAWWNGVLISSDNVDGDGGPLPVSTSAPFSRNETVRFSVPAEFIVLGENTLALHGVNVDLDSRDFLLGARVVVLREPAGESGGGGSYIGGILNEIGAGVEEGSAGFVELYNPTRLPLDLGGHFVVSSDLAVLLETPAGIVLQPGGFISLTGEEVGVRFPPSSTRYVLIRPDGRTVLDDLEADPRPGRSFGRFPDGSGDDFVLGVETPGAANVYTEVKPVVVNEIQYHPPWVEPAGDCARDCSDRLQWIELYNRSAAAVDLSAWRLTGAVRFEFPAGTSLASGGYLVVAADRAAFLETHAGVALVVGDWTGRLSHASETLVLRDALGNPVDRVEYGDGGPRNDEEPADGVDDRTFRGSDWPPEPDGEGPTLELVHAELSNRSGLAWRASAEAGGTPGAVNSTFDAQPGPVVRSVDHDPNEPTSADAVRVTCRISSVGDLVSTALTWQVDGEDSFRIVPLVDDGSGRDELAGDGRWTAEIPPQENGTIVAFAIDVVDASGDFLRVPVPPEEPPYAGAEGPFFLYEVDDTAAPALGTPSYRIIQRAADRRALRSRDETSNVLLPATFIADGHVRHVVGLRYRGESSRGEPNRSYKVRTAPENRLEGVDNINLNAANGGRFGDQTFTELLAADLYRRAGSAYPQEWNIALHFAGEVGRHFDTRYIQKEAYDDEFLERSFGGSDHGNLYRARNPNRGQRSGNISFRGEDVAPYRPIYEKRSNEEVDDYSDIIELCRLFDEDETDIVTFSARVESVVDARQWAQFFAVMACLTNTDGGIWNNNGEDYFLYRVPDDSLRADAGKWLLLPWDLEETFTRGDERLFRSDVDAIERFFSVPRLARFYYEELYRLRDGVFSRFEMRKRYAFADRMFAAEDVFDVVDEVDTNVTQRLGYFDLEAPRELGAGAVSDGALGCGERLWATGDTVRLAGNCHPVDMLTIEVNEVSAPIDVISSGDGPFGATWQIDVPLQPGSNPIEVVGLSGAAGQGSEVGRLSLLVERLEAPLTEVSGAVTVDAGWSRVGSPYHLVGNVRIQDGATLTIEPGVVILAEDTAGFIVESGSLRALGTSAAPILLLATRCGAEWEGIVLDQTGTQAGDPTTLLQHCVLRDVDNRAGFGGCVAADGSKLRVEDSSFRNLTANAIDVTESTLEVFRTEFTGILEGIHATRSTSTVSECVFRDIAGNNDAIDFDGSGPERSLIERCRFEGGSDDGVDLGGVTADVRDNVFHAIGDKAISVEIVGDQGQPAITGNLIWDCGTGMAIKDGIIITEGDHNTVTRCQEGINLFAKDNGRVGGEGTFNSSIVWNNGIDVAADEFSSVALNWSTVSSDEVFPGVGNLASDPLFRDPLAGDFSLLPGSPCIGSGENGTDMGAVQTGGGGEGAVFVRGDSDLSGELSISDAIRTLAYLFQGGAGPACLDRVDANDDGEASLTDAVFTLAYLFQGGAAPPAPFPGAGRDPTADALACPR